MCNVAGSYLPSSSLQLKLGISCLLMCGPEFENSSEKQFIHLVKVNFW